MAIVKLILFLSFLQVLLTIAFYNMVNYGIKVFTGLANLSNIIMLTFLSAIVIFLSLILLSIIYKINSVKKNE
jgi:hypothetical protein